ncbi:PPC domain-containing DNA-binding protein [Variovorax sp. dw_954]|uniref:PPC domain-containing DNA-binding protein n=1 Tax=Variovorax sp. dw_954 TaxID=2720078 RepID=UPI001BD62C27|nr:PPC domain-containing DNA-binding protein [Variovorax sp. dw_954]
MKPIRLLGLAAALAALVATALPAREAQAQDLKGKYVRTPTGYLMVLRNGDDVIANLERLAVVERIPSASFVGIGFMREATFGFYDFSRKAFDPKTFNNVEVANLTGTIAWKEGKPSIHAHGLVTDGSFMASGGHLLGLTVGTGSSEITVLLHPEKYERFVDPAIGANVLGLPGHQ